jgi:hypothetical protein
MNFAPSGRPAMGWKPAQIQAMCGGHSTGGVTLATLMFKRLLEKGA